MIERGINVKSFKKVIWEHYKKHKRDLPWRHTRDPYKIFVSEIMLQQTQASRVEMKYKLFLEKFPTVQALAQAKLSTVLKEWQGLGYNRRAIFLKQTAERIQKEFEGKFPKDYEILCSLPGIGPTTSGDILIFAWNIPVVVIETNIRSVFIHFFFKYDTSDQQKKKVSAKVNDREILPLIARTLDKENPREWYSALLDYGAYLKKTSNPNQQSIHHVKQSQFIGSHRQKRAVVLRTMLQNSGQPHTTKTLGKILGYKSKILSKILLDLEKEGFLLKKRSGEYLVKS